MPKPVVFIPGYPSSKLKFRPENWTIFPPALEDLLRDEKRRRIVELLSAPRFHDDSDDVQPGEPLRGVLGIIKYSDALYDLLSGKFGYDLAKEAFQFRAVGWDWRKGIDEPQTVGALRSAIVELHERTGERVVVMPHSTGGLVLRCLLSSEPQLAQRIDQVIAFGVPWCGSLASLRQMTDPEQIGLFGPLALSADDVERVMTHAQTAFDLIPPDPAQTVLGASALCVGEDGAPLAPLLHTGWMRHEHMRPLAAAAHRRFGARARSLSFGVRVTNVAGWGTPTLTRAIFGEDTVAYDTTIEGDGTNALASVVWPDDVRSMIVPIGAYPVGQIPFPHPRVWDSPPVLQLLSEVLFDAERRPFVAVAVDPDDFSNPAGERVRLRVSASDEHGQALSRCTIRLKFGGPGRTFKLPPGATRMEIVLTREGLQPNVNATRFFRLPIDVKWQGGRTEVVTIFPV